MLGKDISRALGGISDEMILDAADAYRRKRKGRAAWFRAAAAVVTVAILLAALSWPGGGEDEIVTAPGILKVYAYDLTSGTTLDEMVSYELEEGIELPAEYGWHISTDQYPGLPMTLSVDEALLGGEEIVFDVTVSGGECFRELGGAYGKYYYGPAYLGQTFTLENHQTVCWRWTETDLESWTGEEEDVFTGFVDGPGVTYFLEGKAYVDIVIRAGENIVGSVVIKIYAEDTSLPQGSMDYIASRYYAAVIQSVYFPQINGEYQNVTKEDVSRLMNDYE